MTRERAATERVIELPDLVRADDVERQLGCGRTEAYEHLRACAIRYHGRDPQARTMLRAAKWAWLKYLDEVVLCASTGVTVPKAGRPSGTTRRGDATSAARAAGTNERPRPSPVSGSKTRRIRPAQPL